MRKHILIFLIVATICIPIQTEAVDPFTVRVIYFKPADAPHAPLEKIRQLMQDTQEFYASEMERNGFGDKTFEIETSDNEIVIHNVRGAHDADHYYHNTYQRMYPELPREFTAATPKSQDNIHVYIIGGLDLVWGGALGVGWTISGWRAGGNAVLPGDRLNVPIIAHEIGHAFGLFHNDVIYTMMGLWDGPILDYEARWLSKSHYFNEKHIRSDIPEVIAELPVTAIDRSLIRFRFLTRSKTGLHQSKIIRLRDGAIIVGTDNLNGQNDTAEIDVFRFKLRDGDALSLRIIDVNGNYIYKDTTINNLPLPIKTPNTNKNPDLDKDDNIVEVPDPEPDPDPDLDKDENIVEIPEPDGDEDIEDECPTCRPEDIEKNEVNAIDLSIAYQNKLVLTWARLKRTRGH